MLTLTAVLLCVFSFYISPGSYEDMRGFPFPMRANAADIPPPLRRRSPFFTNHQHSQREDLVAVSTVVQGLDDREQDWLVSYAPLWTSCFDLCLRLQRLVFECHKRPNGICGTRCVCACGKH